MNSDARLSRDLWLWRPRGATLACRHASGCQSACGPPDDEQELGPLKGPRAHRDQDAGFVSIQFLAATGLSLVVLVWMLYFVTVQYGRGVIRAALYEGARAGSQAPASETECETRAQDVLRDLLGGQMGREITVRCEVEGDLIRASAEGVFRKWLDLLPDVPIQMTTVAVKEHGP